MSKKVGVVLSGCGVYDGAEIHEAVLTLLALQREGADVLMTAPDKEQMHVINHLTGDVMEESRNVLVEAARIARGNITPLAQVKAEDLDAVVFPGGFGAAKNLSSFAVAGTEMTVDEDVTRLVAEMREAHKPIGLICISPTIGAKLIPGVKLTVGAACEASEAMESLGAHHEVTDVAGITVDDEHKVVSTGAYMLGPWVADVARGIDKLVAKVLELA
ncbi:MAG: isoprenoid biosynthesis protein ElbB [Deltaproteobacteria bacterium]|nr:isoprenoid biosynthesis protein ElbB [Deltaproteobacteria bacterium]